MIELLYWFSVLTLVYTYLGYPLLVRAWAALAPRPVRRSPARPTVTVVVTAYNEERSIEAKLENILALDYPEELLDIVVASDASSDRTDELVRAFGSPARLLRVEGRQGKTACQNEAAADAEGEILLFTDATTEIDPAALGRMVENFADPSVGSVAGTLVYRAAGDNVTAKGGAAYWGYELGLRRPESLIGSLVGVSGCLYAVRRSAYRPIDPDLISDFVIAFKMREQGLRTVLEPEALCYEDTLDRAGQEIAMRVRVAIRSLNALVTERRFLNPLRYGRFAWQLWSHKVLRYAAPLLWGTALATNVVLAGRPVYALLLAGQFVLIGAGLLGGVVHDTKLGRRALDKPYYLLLTNAAALLALLRYLRGERAVTWTPVR